MVLDKMLLDHDIIFILSEEKTHTQKREELNMTFCSSVQLMTIWFKYLAIC